MIKVGEYEMQNEEKYTRAKDGTLTSHSEMIGGVGDEDPNLLLATYDKLGGLILFGGRKVKTGSFWDFKANKPIEKPEPLLQISVGDEIVEIPVGEKLPIEVEAYETLKKKKASKVVKKKRVEETEE